MGKGTYRLGQTLLGILITLGIMSSVALTFMMMHQSQTKATRNIAARGAINDLSHALDLLLGSQGCQTTGSANYIAGGSSPVAVTQTPATAGPPPTLGSYALSVETLKFASGAIALTSLSSDPNFNNMIQPYRVAGITLTPTSNLTAIGGPGATEYPFQMTVTFTSPKGFAPTPINKYIVVYTDGTVANNVVGACVAGQSGSAEFKGAHCRTAGTSCSATVTCSAGKKIIWAAVQCTLAGPYYCDDRLGHCDSWWPICYGKSSCAFSCITPGAYTSIATSCQ